MRERRLFMGGKFFPSTLRTVGKLPAGGKNWFEHQDEYVFVLSTNENPPGNFKISQMTALGSGCGQNSLSPAAGIVVGRKLGVFLFKPCCQILMDGIFSLFDFTKDLPQCPLFLKDGFVNVRL